MAPRRPFSPSPLRITCHRPPPAFAPSSPERRHVLSSPLFPPLLSFLRSRGPRKHHAEQRRRRHRQSARLERPRPIYPTSFQLATFFPCAHRGLGPRRQRRCTTPFPLRAYVAQFKHPRVHDQDVFIIQHEVLAKTLPPPIITPSRIRFRLSRSRTAPRARSPPVPRKRPKAQARKGSGAHAHAQAQAQAPPPRVHQIQSTKQHPMYHDIHTAPTSTSTSTSKTLQRDVMPSPGPV